MSVHAVRPSFRMRLPLPPVEVLARVRAGLCEEDCLCEGSMGAHGFELGVHSDHEHFWSPWLTVEVGPDEDGSLLHARFSPKPQVWTLFIALYATTFFLGLGALMFGTSQWVMGDAPSALWGVLIAGAVGMGLYGAALIGQGLGGAQMYVLRRFLDQHLPPPLSE